MAFRFWRRIQIAPGVTLNLSKGGGSVSLGPRGAKFTVGSRGKRATVGLPGTGFFYTVRPEREEAGAKQGAPSQELSAHPLEKLTLSFFKRLITPNDEKALVDGCRELVLGHEEKALEHLENALHLADGAYLAGFLALKQGQLEKAGCHLAKAAGQHRSLGRTFTKYGISPHLNLSITNEVSAHISPDLRGVLLGLVEVYQHQNCPEAAMACLKRLQRLEPDDLLVKLSLAELLWETQPKSRDLCQQILQLAQDIENETPIHAALLLYKARALRELGLLDAAREVLTKALRRQKDRSEELLCALRYERAQVYEALGKGSLARKELQTLYAQDPNYEDVAARLGL